jgi:HlyD family secretion protein
MAVTGDGTLRSAECKIVLAEGARGLPINTNVTVSAVVNRHSHVLTLPREAVHIENGSHYAYRVDGNRLEKTPVQVGLMNPMRVEITGGLSTTDTVALRAVNDGRLKNNLRITSKLDHQ